MNGRFRRACSRCASRTGNRDKVKFAEEKRASADSGGRPCLQTSCQRMSKERFLENSVSST